MRQFNKIFVISLPRCATVSLSEALSIIGIPTAHLGKIYTASHSRNAVHHDAARLERIYEQLVAGDFELDILRECRGLVDYPVCCMPVIERMDHQYPGSLFINVRRDNSIDAWLQSVERHFVGLELLHAEVDAGLNASAESRKLLRLMHEFRSMTFGQSEFDAIAYRQAYTSYQHDVARYFETRPSEILQIADVSDLNNGFSLLTEFLETDVPTQAFPRNDAHSLQPKQAFMRALAAGSIASQTGLDGARR